MNEVQKQLVDLMDGFIKDAAKPSKAAHQRMRAATLKIAKLGKDFRRLSLKEDKE